MRGRLGVCVMAGDFKLAEEAVAMLLEPLGRVRVVSVITDGKDEKR